jgi:AcrR family transcriptional regulator
MTPSQIERTEATTTALIGAARELFAADGYAATSLDAVVAKAGVTKGALYHHFSSKRDLFAAVFAAEQVRISGAVIAAAGCRAFVEICQEPGVQRIFLLDAPTALGWEMTRELESGSLKLMEQGLERAIEAGRLADRPVKPLAHLLFGAVCETAMVVARAEDQDAALEEALAELGRVLRSMAAPAAG